ncbi:MAG TPA: TonB-dependent receptor [Xanthobacteraceae bacterium]|nr:TonB-dependent receptor [Xanthobacteraceae bacterium]
MRRSHMRSRTALALLLTLSASPLAAQVIDLPQVVISANQFPMASDRVGSAVTVLLGNELREKNVPSLEAALRTVPGMSVNRTGSRGSVTEIRMRGAENNHLLVLIDGIEVNALANLAFDFADVPIDDIERIEVIRGPQSGIYGSNAHAGVISIVTRTGKGLKGAKFNGRVEGGMLGTYSGGFNLRDAVGPVYGSVTATGYGSDGYNISHFGSERDGSRAFTGTAKFGVDFSEYLNVEGVVRYGRRSVDGDPQDFDCTFDPISSTCPPTNPATYGLVIDGNERTDHEGLAARIGATLKLWDGRWIQTANAKLFDETLTQFSNGAQSSQLGGTRETFDYKSTTILDTNLAGGERHTFTVAADHRRETYGASFLPGVDFEKKRLGLAAEYVLDLPTHTTISGAVRHDWNDPFENVTTWRLALSQRLPATASRIHASIGKGITDPDHTEILGFPAFFILPNSNLKPESSIGWDVGLEQSFWNGRLITDVTYFSTAFTDKIQASFVGFNTLFVNAPGTSHRQGVEVAATWNVTDRFSIITSYTYTHARTALNVAEIRRPAHSGSIEATLHSVDGRGRATIGADYNGTRTDTRFAYPANFVARMPATTIAWASLSYDVTDRATAFVRVENLLDHRYEELFSFRAQPFAAYGGLKVKLGEK